VYIFLTTLLWLFLSSNQPAVANTSPVLEVYVRDGCVYCSRAENWLESWQKQHPGIDVQIKNISHSKNNFDDYQTTIHNLKIAVPAVPLFIFENQYLVGFDENRSPDEIQKLLKIEIKITLPSWANPKEMGLPLFTVVVGLIDGFNPCAMWVLVFLLSMLVHVKNRGRMFAIAGVFVCTSGIVYFAFMAAWLGFFSALGLSPLIRWIVGLTGITIAAFNLKDFFSGFSNTRLVLSDTSKSKISKRVRAIVTAENLPVAMASVAALAILVNIYELLCTAGLPALYTQILSQQQLSYSQHLGYLALYNLAYVLDDGVMVFASVWALSIGRLNERAGRFLKLLSGIFLISISLLMILKPEWLRF
jgi:glutaredoxin